ncbi:conserved hypothetical protein [Shewanella halifaxensis HAW-EB4]|uniref:MazG nucleotide pyrophosphohydrolase n=1 Tax=Shewanella halifaxensis (strain HAW-EB4) TaxID=458817 RepID=B0TQV7_SHEHH|nr:nucleotide pyrophosphohydrolase [Shewanella halifaxensis]ABZ76352.1 conserved hypothetical protein [Shewanella halifaxensis HAW-EB4]
MKDKETSLLINQLKEFNSQRDWAQFHSPKNLAMALAGEASELMKHFQWLTEKQSYLEANSKTYQEVREELADVYLYLLQLSDVLGIELHKAASDKLEVNESKYPVHLSKGTAKKYTDL